MRRYPCLAMNAHDLSELYTYLELFTDTYTDCEREITTIQASIRELYMVQYQCDDAESAMRRLRNPREAGRKKHYSGDAQEQVLELSRQGKSVREISRLTGIPKSTVQRLRS